MASQRITDDFKKHFDHFVTLCHAGGHRPTTALLVSTMWPSNESETDVIEMTKELEDHFEMVTPSSIRPIPKSIRFDGSRITACKAINSLILEIEKDVEDTTKSISETDTIILLVEPDYFQTLGTLDAYYFFSFTVSSDRQGRERVQ